MSAKEAAIAVGTVVGSAVLIFCVGVAVGGFYERSAAQLTAAKSIVVAVKDVRVQEHQAVDINQRFGIKAEKQKEKTRGNYQGIARATPAFITADVDRRYLVPNGFVSVWNAAALGDLSRLSAAPGELAAEPSTVPLSAVAAAHTADTEYCRTELDKFQSLWDTWEAHVALANKGGK